MDEECELMLGRYNDRDETALVDKNAYVYYQHGIDKWGSHWYWDNNEYDLLVERAATGIVCQDITKEGSVICFTYLHIIW